MAAIMARSLLLPNFGDRDGGQYPDDHHDDQQLDEGEASVVAAHGGLQRWSSRT